MTESLLYLYCVAEGEPARLPDVTAVTWADLHAVLRPVDAAEFEGLVPGADGEVPPALADLLVRHDQTVRAVFAGHNLVPMRFGMAVSDRAAVVRYLQEEYGELKAILDRVRDHAEWGVKWQRPEPGAGEGAAQAPDTGRSYLRRRQQELHEQKRAAAEWGRQVQRSHDSLAPLATEVWVPEQTADSPEIGCAYLVHRDQEEAFIAAVAAQADQGMALRLTGPWPPYSFCAGTIRERAT